jgi:hypothetical protein
VAPHEKSAQATPVLTRAFEAYGTVTLVRDDGSARCSAQVISSGVRGLNLMSPTGRRFPGWIRSGHVVTIVSLTTRASYLARVHIATATTAQIELMRESEKRPSTRSHARAVVSEPARVAEVADASSCHIGLLRDVSLGGCRVSLATAIAVDTKIRITSRLAAMVVELLGTIVAVHDAGEITCDHGVVFDHVDPPAQRAINDFVRRQRAA